MWSSELTHLSMACKDFRREVWKRKMERIIIRATDDMQEVSVGVGLAFGDCVRYVAVLRVLASRMLTPSWDCIVTSSSLATSLSTREPRTASRMTHRRG